MRHALPSAGPLRRMRVPIARTAGPDTGSAGWIVAARIGTIKWFPARGQNRRGMVLSGLRRQHGLMRRAPRKGRSSGLSIATGRSIRADFRLRWLPWSSRMRQKQQASILPVSPVTLRVGGSSPRPQVRMCQRRQSPGGRGRSPALSFANTSKSGRCSGGMPPRPWDCRARVSRHRRKAGRGVENWD